LRQLENWVNIQRSEGTWVKTAVPFQLVGFTEIVLAIGIIVILIVLPSGITGGRELAWPRRKPARPVDPLPEPADQAGQLEPLVNPTAG
jgi:branched-chain amino acid transport system permease protein